jgi:outer membrane receptor protein involved in Fe transport
MKTKYKLSCAAAALLAGVGHVGGAFAADAADASSARSTAVEEIVVTATRRNETVQNVPQTVQAFGDQQLQQLNITNLNSLIQYTPNVTFANNGPGQGNIYMRGLSAGFAGNQSSATISPFPNVALYLDDMSMQFPSRNVDVYAADLERVEVLEGPQGSLFGGGAEAGVLRYITNKPKLDVFEGSAEAQYGFTSHGADNENGRFVINVPILTDKLAVRVVVYDDHQGGYIDNVPSTFTRSNSDLGNHYLNILPSTTTGLCPNGLAPSNVAATGGFCALANAPQANNYSVAAKNQNPATYQGVRAELLYKINEDWNILITQSLQNLNAEGVGAEEPYGSDFQKLGPLQETSFSPSYDKDNFESTAWTVNGAVGPLKLVYTGGYMTRHIDQQQDYTNYARGFYGTYYQCVSSSGLGVKGTAPQCFSPVAYWNDKVKNTHFTQEFRVSTPDDWRLRGIAGAYYEQFRIQDNMNFDYKSIPSCTPSNLALALSNPNDVCVANTTTAPGATSNIGGFTILPDNTAFGEDTQRGYNQEAAFVSLDFDIIPHVLTITGGTRYFQYNEFETGSQYATGGECVNVPNGDCGPSSYKNIDSHNDHITYHGFKSRAGVNWHVNDRTLAYFLWSQGFRPGAFNRAQGAVAPLLVDASGAAVPVGTPAGEGDTVVKQYNKPNGYAPDSLTNYEIGFKTELFDRRLQVNLSAYYMDWDNVQLVFFNPAALGNTSFGVNGPDYNVKGVELQLVGRILPGLTAQGSGTYNHETQTNSPCLKANLLDNSCITELYSAATGMNGSFENPFGATGTTPAFAPKFQGNIRLRYEWAIGDYKPYATASAQYTGSMYNQPATYSSGEGVQVPGTTLLRYYQPAYATADIAVGVRKDKWYGEVYCNNLFDNHASQFTSSAQFIESMVPLRPRIVMLKVGASF